MHGKEKENGFICIGILLSMGVLFFMWHSVHYVMLQQRHMILERTLNASCLYGAEAGLSWACKGLREGKLEEKTYILPEQESLVIKVTIFCSEKREIEIISTCMHTNGKNGVRLKMEGSLGEENIVIKAIYPM